MKAGTRTVTGLSIPEKGKWFDNFSDPSIVISSGSGGIPGTIRLIPSADRSTIKEYNPDLTGNVLHVGEYGNINGISEYIRTWVL
jgi:hypothetical protein